MSVRVFVTNDDGGRAPGLAALVEEVTAVYPRAVVMASATECGDYGTSLRREGWARRTSSLDGSAPADPLEFQATPALLVKAACQGVFGPPPDVVVAGVNYGPNVGRETLHSGTVGAVLAALNLGVPALALSLDDVHSTGGQEDGLMHWQTASALAVPLIDWLSRTPSPAALSVNVPNRPSAELTGVRPARLAGTGVRLAHTDPPAADTDVALLTAGYVTISALVALDGTPADAAAAAHWLEPCLQRPLAV
jgi:5'-nucleotidase